MSSRSTPLLLAFALLIGASSAIEIQAESPPAPFDWDAAKRDVVFQRDDDGRVLARSELRLGPDGNWLRHGAWSRWSPTGELTESGEYAIGQRVGRWTRWLSEEESSRVVAGDAGFQSPLTSQADFSQGRMTGQWIVFDAAGRRCFSVGLIDGVREGRFTAWNSAGERTVQQRYEAGLPVGRRIVRDAATGRLAVAAVYLEGYRVIENDAALNTGDERDPKLTSAGQLLVGPETPQAADDYSTTSVAIYAVGDQSLRHGPWRSWAPNGQLVMEGQFDRGRAGGPFTWRHPNGRLAAAGSFEAGSPRGEWSWWNAEGLQIASGEATGEKGISVAGQPILIR